VQLHQFVIVLVALSSDFSISMAVYAPTHGQGAVLINYFHFFYRTMAGLTVQTGHSHVLTMVKVSQIWQVVNPDPFNWFIVVVCIVKLGISGEIPSCPPTFWICMWQFIQIFAEGILADLPISTPVWQYWQGISYSPACNLM
jgi:hypothetical protein